MGFQSTLPVWGATSFFHAPLSSLMSSIHAPRVGSDSEQAVCNHLLDHFNPRSPCGERPPPHSSKSARGHFNPRSPCGERLSGAGKTCIPLNFNPRSPCGERPIVSMRYVRLLNFNPRSPCGERLLPCAAYTKQKPISIHAPRVGSDSKTAQILLEILSHLNSFAPSEKKKIPFHRKEQGKFIEIF